MSPTLRSRQTAESLWQNAVGVDAFVSGEVVSEALGSSEGGTDAAVRRGRRVCITDARSAFCAKRARLCDPQRRIALPHRALSSRRRPADRKNAPHPRGSGLNRRPGGVAIWPGRQLYAALDDGGNPDAAAKLSDWNGKILRVNPDGRTPADQPAAHRSSGAGSALPGGLTGRRIRSAVDGRSGGDGVERIRAFVTRPERPRRAGQRACSVLPPPIGASSLAFYRGGVIRAFAGNMFVAGRDGDYLFRVRFDEADPIRAVTSEKLLEGGSDRSARWSRTRTAPFTSPASPPCGGSAARLNAAHAAIRRDGKWKMVDGKEHYSVNGPLHRRRSLLRVSPT